MSFDTPAVVVGAGINALGVVRSLKRAHVPAWLLEVDATRPALHTHAAKAVTVASLDGDSFINELVQLGDTRFRNLRPVLLLTQEASVQAVSRARARLAALYQFTLPSRETVDALQHKHGFQRMAEALGAPIPSLVRVRSHADLPALAALHYPIVVKPGTRDAVYSRRFKKAYRVTCSADAIELIGRILTVMQDVVVQEWIDGPDSNIYFCLQAIDRTGRLVAAFSGRKIRSWPPAVGGTASCLPAPEIHAELVALTTRFFRHAGVVGLASMEYKRDAHSGELRMVEPTIGRTDYQEEVATLNGVNLPFAAYCAELGLPFPTPSPFARQAIWRVRSQDIASALAQHQHPDEGLVSHARVVDALWRASDPMPWLHENLQRMRRAFHTRVARRTPNARPIRSPP
jgi:predicted ATP-grasp superfamily ATP-dependent carboligase